MIKGENKMDENTMVNDVLNSVKAELTTYQHIINQTENLGLRQIMIQIRNNDESFQYELFKVAQTKGYYKPEDPATVVEIQNIRNELLHVPLRK